MEPLQLSTIQGAEGALLGSSAISEHLRLLGYPEVSISSMERCGVASGLRIMATCDCDVRFLPLTHHCNLRICASCSKIRQRRLFARFLPVLSSMSKNRSGDQFYFLTISPANYSSFKEGLAHVRESFKKFLRLKYVKDRIRGGLYVLETKQSAENGWNVHLHAIFYGRRLDNQIRGLCNACGQNLIKLDFQSKKYYCANRSCNSLDVIHKKDSRLVSLFKSCSGRDVNVHVGHQSGSFTALAYMLKYVSNLKENFSDLPFVAEYVSGIYHQKLVTAFGEFFNKKAGPFPMLCNRCGSEITFCVDTTILRILDHANDGYVKPPPLDHLLSEFELNIFTAVPV